MGFEFKEPLVGEKRCVTTLITAAKETGSLGELSFSFCTKYFQFFASPIAETVANDSTFEVFTCCKIR